MRQIIIEYLLTVTKVVTKVCKKYMGSSLDGAAFSKASVAC